jgi:hypothetical protein
MEYSKYLWIKHYGKLHKGDITHHLNGDSLDDRIENIIAMPRSMHPCFHSRWGLKKLSKSQIKELQARYC